MAESSGITQIEIGAKVSSKDGKTVGKVDKLIVHAGTGEVGGFLLDPGLIGRNHIVDLLQVASSDAHGVVLKLDADQANHLPEVIHEQRVKAPGTVTVPTGFGGMVTMSGGGDTWYLRGDEGGQLPNTGYDSIIATAPIGNDETENRTNLPDDAVIVNERTEVIGSDGKKIGHLERVVIGEGNRITAIVIKTGWVHRHEFQVPIDLVKSSTDKETYLSVPHDDVEKYALD